MAELELRELKESEFPIWDKFVESSPQGNIYSTTQWLKIIESSTDYKGHILAIFDKLNNIVAGCLFFSIKKVFEIIHPPPLTPFTTILFENKRTNKLSKVESFQEEVIEKLEKKFLDYDYVLLLLHPSVQDLRPFTFRKWKESIHYTYLIDISDASRSWENLNESKRRGIKMAQEYGIRIENSDDINSFYDLYKKYFEGRDFKKLVQKELIKKILNLDNSKLYVAKKDGSNIAFLLIVFDKSFIYTLLTASEPEFKKYQSLSLLVWEIIKENPKKIPKIDFVGANISSISNFKRGFSTELVPYYSVEKCPSKLVNFLVKLRKSF